MSQVKKSPCIFTVQVFLVDHKIWRNLQSLPSKFQIIWDVLSKFSGLLKKSELYSIEFKASV